MGQYGKIISSIPSVIYSTEFWFVPPTLCAVRPLCLGNREFEGRQPILDRTPDLKKDNGSNVTETATLIQELQNLFKIMLFLNLG